MARILVTGATGTVGREVVDRLARRGESVRAVARRIAGMVPPDGHDVEYVQADFRTGSHLRRMLVEVDRVFFLSPLDEYMASTCTQFVAQAEQVGVQKIVRLSAFGAHADSDFTLAQVHRDAEQVIVDSQLDWTFLRPNSFMQNYLTYCGETIRNDSAFFLPQGRGAVSVVDARDIADVAVEALTSDVHTGRAYTLTGPEALNNMEIAAVLSDALDRRITYHDTDEAEARASLRSSGISLWKSEVLMQLYAVSRDNQAVELTNSIGDVLGRPPRTFSQFVHDYRDAFGEASALA